MPTFLEKIGLQNSFTVELDIQLEDFVSRFRKQVDEGEPGMFFFNPFEAFSSSLNEYMGLVSKKEFNIRRKAKIFNTNSNAARAKGTFEQADHRLLIHTTVSSWHPMMFIFPVFLLIVWTVALSLGEPLFIFVVSLQTLLITIIPYFSLRKSTKNMQRELEREFFFLTKN